jgi:septal ring factor EnvC (AmiA/AmiB activator)
MKSLTTRKKMETKTEEKIIYLEGRLDDVERELSIITSKKYELEQRRKTLLEKINKLDEQRMDAIPAN